MGRERGGRKKEKENSENRKREIEINRKMGGDRVE